MLNNTFDSAQVISMTKQTIRKYTTAVSLLVGGLSVTPAFAQWYVNQSEGHGYYRAQEYHNEKYGDFAPADINEKLLGHLATNNDFDIDKTVKPPLSTIPSNKFSATTSPPPATTAPRKFAQNQPPYVQNNQRQDSYNQARYYAQQGNQRHTRHTKPQRQWHNKQSNFSPPWNNQGANFSSPFNGPWNNPGSNFKMPWGNSKGSNFSMPWGNHMGSNMGNHMQNNQGNNKGYNNRNRYSWGR